ncbi:FecCD family ABC transporter permease [Cohnella sp. 56]|uniref:FecCD family ABC transporter permease n=1 Tax=Cohnella sp. 56 TaxID=3113722 RepID=UPI0030E8446E
MQYRRNKISLWILVLAPAAIAAALILSVLLGSKDIGTGTVLDALLRFDPGNVDHQIIRHSRIPRAVGAMLVGAFLAVSGALMQGMTRNYLASPSVLGVTDGSAFAITLCMVLAPNASSMGMIACSLIGSAASIAVVFGLSFALPGGLSPVRMAILGTVVGTFLSGVSAAVATYFQISQNISFWYNARLHQLDPGLIQLAVPFAVVGLGLAMWIARPVTLLSLGEETASGLGQRTGLVKFAAMASVVILTGISVAIAGKIAFIGLIVPHIVRYATRDIDYARLIPCAAVAGGVFLTLCDVLARFLNYPFEMPIGVVTAVLGVPFILYLIRTKGGGRHAS